MVRKHAYRQEEDEEVEQSRVAARVAAAVAVAVAAGKEKSAKIENSIVLKSLLLTQEIIESRILKGISGANHSGLCVRYLRLV